MLALLTNLLLLAASGNGALYVLSTPDALRATDHMPYAEVLIIDPVTGHIRRTIRVGFSADMQVSPDGKKAYVSSSYVSSEYSVDRKCFLETYDTETGALIAKVLSPDGQQYSAEVHETAMTMSPDGSRLHVKMLHVTKDSYNFYNAVFDTSKQTFVASKKHPPLRRKPYYGIAAHDSGSREAFDYLASRDVSTGEVIRTIKVQPFFDLTLSKDGKTIYLLHPFSSQITLIDALTMKQTGSIQLVGKAPYYAAIR